MASAKQDYVKFVQWLHEPVRNVPSNVRRLANLALANFDPLAGTSRQHSNRSAYLANLARQLLARTADTLPVIEAGANDGAWAWKRLRNLTLGPFRGFRTPEPFDLQKRVILFYGPNGSGKTSLCEALEFALLGVVEEAAVKRIDAQEYLFNIHAGRFAAPVLIATDHRNQQVNVVANADAYRFCFIEKNRIDSFSRMAARPTVQRADLIATLFGMEKFSDFVSHFNDSMDGQLVLTNTKQIQLAARRNALTLDQAKVDKEQESLQILSDEEAALALTHSKGMTYLGLKALIGNAEAPGRLQLLNDIVNAIPPALLNMTRERLRECYENANKAYDQVELLAASLAARSSQVSFKDLFTAVLALQPTESDHCPACDTPLIGSNHTEHNPYQKAAAGLQELRELGELQENYQRTQGEAARTSRELRDQLLLLSQFMVVHQQEGCPVCLYLAKLPQALPAAWWRSVYKKQDNGNLDVPTLEQILEIADRITMQDGASRQALELRNIRISERDILNQLQMSIQKQDLKRTHIVEELSAARRRITAFEVTYAHLIKEASQEIRDIERDSPIKTAYDRFLMHLKLYRNQLPGNLMAGLNELAMNLYNDFNRHDLDADKLSALYLPLTGEEKINLSFRGAPGVRLDALSILSEGHIRCLGLAILLAKGLSIQSPLIVFDDAINAIDHDHRSGIRQTIFDSDTFVNTQIIVTCHSNEFIKDIQNNLPQHSRNDWQEYLLRHHTGNNHPRVRGNITSRNYVAKARAAKDQIDDCEALAKSRQALEMLADKTWRWLGSHNLGLLSLQLAGVGAEPGLRNLCDALRKKLTDASTFTHANKPVLLEALDRILGIPVQNLVWFYLNKGTHEEGNREDFDSIAVESVVQTLEQIDGLDLRPGR